MQGGYLITTGVPGCSYSGEWSGRAETPSDQVPEEKVPQTGGSASPVQGVLGGVELFQQPLGSIPTNPFPAEAPRPELGGHSSSQAAVRSPHHPSPEPTAHLRRPAHPPLRIPDPLRLVGLGSFLGIAISEEAQLAPSPGSQALAFSGVPAGQGSRQLPPSSPEEKREPAGASPGAGSTGDPLQALPPPCGLPARPGPGPWGTTVFLQWQVWRGGVRKPAGRRRPARAQTLGGQGGPSPASGSLARRSVSQRRSPFLPRREAARDPGAGGGSSRALLLLPRGGEKPWDEAGGSTPRAQS